MEEGINYKRIFGCKRKHTLGTEYYLLVDDKVIFMGKKEECYKHYKKMIDNAGVSFPAILLRSAMSWKLNYIGKRILN